MPLSSPHSARGKLDVVHLKGGRPFRDVEGCLSLSLWRFKLLLEISWALGSLAVFMCLKVFYVGKNMFESLAYLSPDGVWDALSIEKVHESGTPNLDVFFSMFFMFFSHP